MTDHPTPSSSSSERPPAPKRPYRAPQLTEYGSVAKLTQSGGATIIESFVPRMAML